MAEIVLGVWQTKRVFVGAVELMPEKSYALRQHSGPTEDSQTGYSWGTGGNGAAQLALALMLHFTGNKEDSLGLYQTFKKQVVGMQAKGSNFQIDSSEITGWIERCAKYRCTECGAKITYSVNMAYGGNCETCHDTLHPEDVPEAERPGANNGK